MKTNVKKQKNVTGKNIDTNYGRRETMVFKENVTKFAIVKNIIFQCDWTDLDFREIGGVFQVFDDHIMQI